VKEPPGLVQSSGELGLARVGFLSPAGQEGAHGRVVSAGHALEEDSGRFGAKGIPAL
jgi:hypothetical protein